MKKQIVKLELIGDRVYVIVQMTFDNSENFTMASVSLGKIASKYFSRDVTTVTDTVDQHTVMSSSFYVDLEDLVDVLIHLSREGFIDGSG